MASLIKNYATIDVTHDSPHGFSIDLSSNTNTFFLTGQTSLDTENYAIEITGTLPVEGTHIVIYNDATFTTDPQDVNKIVFFGSALDNRFNESKWKLEAFRIANKWWIHITFNATDNNYIEYRMLKLDNDIVNSDIASNAAISLNKLAPGTPDKVAAFGAAGVLEANSLDSAKLTHLSDVTSPIQSQLNNKPNSGEIDEDDLAAGTQIPYSKLVLTEQILAEDIHPDTKIPYDNLDLADSILDSDIKSNAEIAISKLGGLTANRAIVTDNDGLLTASDVTDNQINYSGNLTEDLKTTMDDLDSLSRPMLTTLTAGTHNLDGTIRNFVCDPTGGDVIIYLPEVADCQKLQFNFSCISSSNAVKVYPHAGGDVFNFDGLGTSFVTLTTAGDKLTITNDGVDTWHNFSKANA